jgi:DNA repair protein RecO (recombination protein O)
MHWDDIGYLISKNKYNENSIIAEIYTENHGKCSGIIFGASSKKIKNYLQIGNKIHVNNSTKTEGRIGYFKVEILKATTPLYFDDKKKLLCLSSAMNLIKLLTAESQINKKIFDLLDKFFDLLTLEEWIKEYIFWELELFKLLGYDLVLKDLVNSEIINNKTKYYVNTFNQKKIVPNFLIEKNLNIIDINNLLKGLSLVGDYLEKSILKPNNINHPPSRIDFINMLK